jgi:3-phenylpropionate/trans-cinnamate dioxygenase ferredoxin reductase subunit
MTSSALLPVMTSLAAWAPADRSVADCAAPPEPTMLSPPPAASVTVWPVTLRKVSPIAGLSAGHDAHVLRGEPTAAGFSVYYFRQGRLIAVDSLNRPADHMLARRLLTAGTPVLPAQAADPAFDLKAL